MIKKKGNKGKRYKRKGLRLNKHYSLKEGKDLIPIPCFFFDLFDVPRVGLVGGVSI